MKIPKGARIASSPRDLDRGQGSACRSRDEISDESPFNFSVGESEREDRERNSIAK
jgi:hypothetical protein